MNYALRLAWLAKGSTSPNPSVGAVVVKNGEVIASGFTSPPGGHHAERMALTGLNESLCAGATLYVTLEPCSFHGRTPPCTDIILEKKIARVVVAVKDPHPEVSGRGIEILKKAGVQVELGLLAKKAEEINRDFFIWIQEKRPLVTLKYAMTLDGKIATHSGDSKWITSPRSRRMTHILRYRSDAILVGENTARLDNPTLNVRLPKRNKALLRIILSSNGKLPLDLNIFQDELPTLVAVKQGLYNQKWANQVLSLGKEIWVDHSEGEKINIKELLRMLGKREIISLFVEGGSRILGAFLDVRCADKVFCFMGNQILGDGLGPFSGIQRKFIKDAVSLDDINIKRLYNNLLIYGSPRWNCKTTKVNDITSVPEY